MFKVITPQEASERIAQGQVEVIDVREHHEWADGHLLGARLVPLAEFRRDPQAQRSAANVDVIFVCAAGVRSETAARVAAQSGFSRVFNLKGGTRAWAKAGLPLEVESIVTAAE